MDEENQKIRLILCYSDGGYENGTWETIVTEVPFELSNTEEVASWVQDETDLVGENCVYVGVMDWVVA